MFRMMAIVATLSVAFFGMRAPVYASQPVTCGDSCGGGGGGTGYTPGCNGVAQDSSSGDMQTFDSSDDDDPDWSDVSMSYTVPDAGTWNVSYTWQTVDAYGDTVDSGQFSGDAFSVPNDGKSYRNNVSATLPRPPTGGALYINVYGINDLMQPLEGEGDTQNYDCQVTF